MLLDPTLVVDMISVVNSASPFIVALLDTKLITSTIRLWLAASRHAHNCLCQLKFLATYVKGMGLEDLEGGECFFSKSNALAPSIHHAGIFNQKQKIVEFVKHMDQNETYQNLSK